jgi:LmbE family N-acetylglucosaminyl deacetylase
MARRVVVIAPHPDDEAIGAFELICRARRRGASTHVIVVSDGGASHPGSRTWPVARLTRERRRETRRAMRRCGLTPRELTFLDLPDGQLEAALPRLTRALGSTLRRLRPDLVAGPARIDAHADHRAVAEALRRVRLEGAQNLAYRVWPVEEARARGTYSVPLNVCRMAMKRCLIRSYRTQTGLIRDAEAGFAMTSRHLAAFVRPCEEFRRL